MSAPRFVEFRDVPFGTWMAFELVMADQMAEGTFQPTVAVFHWSKSRPTFLLCNNNDGKHIDVDAAERNHADASRLLSLPGGGSFVTSEMLLVLTIAEHPYGEPDWLLSSQTDRAGAVTTQVLRDLGLDAHYRGPADTEVRTPESEIAHKVGSTSAGHLHHPNFWTCAASFAWEVPSSEVFKGFQETIYIPPEKFADKPVQDSKARMESLSSLLAGKLDTKDELCWAAAVAHSRDLWGKSCEPAELAADEQEAIQSIAGYFHSRTWITQPNTSAFDLPAFEGERIGRATIKKRKLIECAVGLAMDGTIGRVRFTGEFFIHPQPSLTERGGVASLEAALIGVRADDEAAIDHALADAYERYALETPQLQPGDFGDTARVAVQHADRHSVTA